jgi:hypothetical protein
VGKGGRPLAKGMTIGRELEPKFAMTGFQSFLADGILHGRKDPAWAQSTS